MSLKELSKEKKITQQEIADTIGVHQTLVSQWFTGKTKPSLDHAQALAKLLGVSTDDVISAVRTKAAESSIVSAHGRASEEKERQMEEMKKSSTEPSIEDCIMVLENLMERTKNYESMFEFFPKYYVDLLAEHERAVLSKVISIMRSLEK